MGQTSLLRAASLALANWPAVLLSAAAAVLVSGLPAPGGGAVARSLARRVGSLEMVGVGGPRSMAGGILNSSLPQVGLGPTGLGKAMVVVIFQEINSGSEHQRGSTQKTELNPPF